MKMQQLLLVVVCWSATTAHAAECELILEDTNMVSREVSAVLDELYTQECQGFLWGLFGNKDVVKISLRNNQLEWLRNDMFTAYPLLETLYLTGNQITDDVWNLPVGVFNGLENLKHLDMAYNKIASIPANLFDPLTKLDSLYIGNNQITHLGNGVFDKLTNLRYLGMCKNPMESVESGVFDKLTQLDSLLACNFYLGEDKDLLWPIDIFDKLPNLEPRSSLLDDCETYSWECKGGYCVESTVVPTRRGYCSKDPPDATHPAYVQSSSSESGEEEPLTPEQIKAVVQNEHPITETSPTGTQSSESDGASVAVLGAFVALFALVGIASSWACYRRGKSAGMMLSIEAQQQQLPSV